MSEVALLVIDMQAAYFRNEALDEKKATLAFHCNRLIEAAKKTAVPVLTVVTEHKKNQSTWTLNMLDDEQGYLFSGTEDVAVITEIDTSGSCQVIKTRDSAFYETNLETKLRDQEITTLILTGVSTHSCVMLTAADAYARNYRVILASEAIASHDPRYHDASLQMLHQEYRQPLMSTDDVIRDFLHAT